MDITIPLLLLCACGSLGEPLSSALKRRSDSSVYASQFARKYEPVAYIAIPLHKPLPVLHFLTSNQQKSKPKRMAIPTPQAKPQPAKYGNRIFDYSASPSQRQYHYAVYNSQKSYNSPVYASSNTQSWYLKPELQGQSKYEIPPLAVNPVIVFAEPSATNHAPLSLAESLSETQLPEPVVLYARPNPQGGYTYRKKPEKRVKVKKDPVIIRIHKYRIVKDDI